MQFLIAAARRAVPRFDHPPGLTHEEAMLEDVRLAILSGAVIHDVIDDDLPIAGRIGLIAHHETPQ